MTPILRGQKSSQTNEIPPHHPTASHDSATVNSTSSHAAHATQPAIQEVTTPPQAQSKDLIDIGHNENLPAAQKDSNDIEKILQSTGTVQAVQQGGLVDFHDELNKNLPSMSSNGQDHGRLRRHDTETSSVDEFVDAEG